MRGGKTSLAAVAKACGCETVIECQAEETGAVLKAAIESQKMTVIVSKCVRAAISKYRLSQKIRLSSETVS